MALYDKYYKEKNYFGDSYPEFISFFKNRSTRGKVLDLGCGQGRDSLALAKLGYDVTGIDISKVGIEQMLNEAKKSKLIVEGEVRDIYSYDRIQDYNIVLLDSMLHFYPKDKIKETNFYNKILRDMKVGSIFCNLLLKSKKNEEHIRSLAQNNSHKFHVIFDNYVKYAEANCDYHMFIVQKDK